jgi:hypothetical protein
MKYNLDKTQILKDFLIKSLFLAESPWLATKLFFVLQKQELLNMTKKEAIDSLLELQRNNELALYNINDKIAKENPDDFIYYNDRYYGIIDLGHINE